MRASRRKFIRDLGALTMGGIACCKTTTAGAASGLGELPIVDTHEHLWDLSRFRLPWMKPGGPLCRSYVPKDYQEASAGLNIVKSVYMEVDTGRSGADRQPLSGYVWPGTSDVCGRLAGLYPRGQLPPVGRGTEGYRRPPRSG